MEITYGASTRLQVSHETIKDCHFLPEIGLDALDDMPHPNPPRREISVHVYNITVLQRAINILLYDGNTEKGRSYSK